MSDSTKPTNDTIPTNGQPASPTDPAPNPFDPAALRLSQDFASAAGVKRVLTTIPCRKPNGQEFVRVRAGEEWRLETCLFEDKNRQETYLVLPALWHEPVMASFVRATCLFVTINRHGMLFLWPAKLPGPEGKSNSWNDSALEAARRAHSQWVRPYSNRPASMYEAEAAPLIWPEPEWPELPLAELVRLCFKDRFIQSLDHPVVLALRGLA